ncbi:hypothetical protein A6D98_09795 [Aliivibrio fischeri]|uniref:hypothetical protein n=1 Tax=Aliivibrio fischeri TaxID=668 RepID=UPI00080E8AC8|nr:hypothetical protein [Aliivibrio fischeri]OCH60883.1 hypothetical protein A6D98_09795 [Aliivibrio fischeri]
MKYARGAGLLCTRRSFQRFLSETASQPVSNEEQAAAVLRQRCQVQSRRELDSCLEAKQRYQQVIRQFNDWMNG